MIGFFPKRYPDELLYSQLCRYHHKSGYPAFLNSCDDLYKHRTVHPSIEFVNAFTDDAMAWICRETAFSDVVKNHTNFPAYARFLPKQRRESAYEALLVQDNSYSNFLCLPNAGTRVLRYCPGCAKADRETVGETYWHREHQLHHVNVCPAHRCYLESADIPISSKSSPGFFDAESAVPYNIEPRFCDNLQEIRLAEYVLDVFREPVDLKNDFPIGDYLHGKLGNYVNESGLVRDMRRFYADYCAFYKGLSVMDEAVMQKIFNGYRFDTYYVCQIAYFLGISSHDLTHLPNEQTNIGLEPLYQSLANAYNIPLDTIRHIGDEVLKHSTVRLQRKSGRKAKQYDKIDKQLFPAVKSAVDSCFFVGKKPKKVSIAAIQRELGLPQKQLAKLPMCIAYVREHMELQAEFWARVLVWAVKDIESSEDTLCLKQITSRFYLRKQDILTALPYVADTDVKAQLEALLQKG